MYSKMTVNGKLSFPDSTFQKIHSYIISYLHVYYDIENLYFSQSSIKIESS